MRYDIWTLRDYESTGRQAVLDQRDRALKIDLPRGLNASFETPRIAKIIHDLSRRVSVWII